MIHKAHLFRSLTYLLVVLLPLSLAACFDTLDQNGGGGGGGGGGDDDDDDDDATGDDDDDDDYDGPIGVTAEGEVIPNGGTYCTPMNTCANTVPLFSEQRTMMTIRNTGSADVTLVSVSLEEWADNEDEEWTLIDTELVPSPLDVDGTVLAAGAGVDFYPRFYPVQSGERGCTISIETDGGTFSFDVTGLGAYDAYFFSQGETQLEKLLGGTSSDELAGGMVVDSLGNAIFTANVSEVIDNFTPDILVGSMSPSGSLNWARIWNGPYRDASTDPGQNSETGGGADSIAVDDDGYVYVVGGTSPNNYNSQFWSLILKLDANDGSVMWEKVWSPSGEVSIASDSSVFYGVDVVDGLVYATGTAHGEADVSLVVFDASSGGIVSQTTFDPHPTYNDRGYTVRADGNGNAYIGGNGSGDAILMRITDADTAHPSVDWAKDVGLGTGGNINSMDLDSSGNAYIAMDVRGASTAFALGRVSSSGTLEWSKAYAASSNQNNNIHVVRVDSGSVYAGGRIGLDLMDAQMGDGMILKLGFDGTEQWSSFYFNGTGPDEISEHRVKGMAVDGGALYLLTQVYTGTTNGDRYWGYWYDGTGELQDFTVNLSNGSATASTVNEGETFDAAAYRNDWAELPGSVVWQDADAKGDGTPPDCDVMLTTIGM
jgi:hypothetical protein